MKQHLRLRELQEWFRGLAPRERVLVGVGAAVVAVTVLFLGIWEPLTKAHHKREADLGSARVLAQRLEEIGAELQQNRASGNGGAVAARSMSLLSAVDQSSKGGALNKPLSRIQPEGDNEVKVWLEGVSFDGLLRWISELETRYGVSAQTVDIEKDPTPGLVSARLSLVRP